MPKEVIELDACLTGCGAWCGSEYYGTSFPKFVLECEHPTAHLELLNLVVAIKVWSKIWAGHRIQIRCDNINTCIAVMKGKSKVPYMQSCLREIYQLVAANDIDLDVVYTPGLEIVLADALSREHLSIEYKNIVKDSKSIENATRLYLEDYLFEIVNTL